MNMSGIGQCQSEELEYGNPENDNGSLVEQERNCEECKHKIKGNENITICEKWECEFDRR